MDPADGPGTPARPELSVGAVCVDGDRILLIRRGQEPGRGWWSVPGGRVEAGETLHEAVVREVAEETGLEVVVERFLGLVERIGPGVGPGIPEDGAGYHFVILDYLVTALDPSATPSAGDDADEVAWAPLADLGDVRLVPGLHDFLADHGIV